MNKLTVEQKGIITLKTESRKLVTFNTMTPRCKLEMLLSMNLIFADTTDPVSYNFGINTSHVRLADYELTIPGDILQDNTEDYKYGLNAETDLSRKNLVLGTKNDTEIDNSEIDIDSKLYDDDMGNSISDTSESLPQKDILEVIYSFNIQADEFEEPEEDTKTFNTIAIGNGAVCSFYSILDDDFTIEPYEQLDIDWTMEFKLPDVPA